MCDAFLTLAQTDKGLSCFLLPRHRPDGTRNAFYIQRLKNKLGNWANASSEVEYRGALAWMVGEEGRGVPTIIEMVASTRFDCMIGSSSLMRQALTQAMHHCAHRRVGGRALLDQPLMQNVLADLALESEAALALTLRMGRAQDHRRDEHEDKFARLVTAIGKYWICKRAPTMIAEASECLGGAGYVEETILPRLYREAPVNSIWEGSGNVQCLDVLRALSKEPGVLEVLFAELGDGHDNARLKVHIQRLKAAFGDTEDIQYRARQLTEEVAVTLQAKLLRFLQDGGFRRVGSDEEVYLDVRVICATQVDLSELCAKGEFRQDLYHRLNVLSLHIPPLRDCLDGLQPLALHFIDQASRQIGCALPTLSPQALERLAGYHWPGNVRQLENTLFQAVSLCEGGIIKPEHIRLPGYGAAQPLGDFSLEGDLASIVGRFEKAVLEGLYKQFPSSRQLGKRLGVSHTTIANKLREHGVGRADG